jgi:hypothetical protein
VSFGDVRGKGLTSPEIVKEVLDVRIPTFSRQSDTADADQVERPASTGTASSPVRPRRDEEATTATDLPPVRSRSDLPPAPPATVTPPPANPPTVVRRSETARAAQVGRSETARAAQVDDTADLRTNDLRKDDVRRDDTGDLGKPVTATEPVVERGPKPRSSMMATLGLILGVGSALLVLSGPLLGYGIGVAVVALILSLGGIHATGKRHVAGKGDALIGMVLSLAAIVVGVLALTGSLSWLGTDMQPVNTFRQWLDAQFVNRF